MKKLFPSMNVGLKASITYVVCSLLSKGLAIITVPIFTRLLSTEEMGLVNLFTSWQSMIASFATLSLTSGGYMLALKEYKDKRDAYMSSVLTLTSIVATALFIAFFAAPAFWSSTLGLSQPLCILMLFTFLLTPATDFWLSRQRYEYKYLRAGCIIVIPAILSAATSILAVIFFADHDQRNLGEIRLFSGYSILLCVSLFLWIHILAKGRIFFHKKFWIYSLQLSIPLIGNSIAMQILSVSDRAMISKMVGNSALGIYGILYTVSSLSLIVWSAINSTYVPYLYENIEKEGKMSSIKRSATKLLTMYGIAAFILTLAAPELVKILATEEYYEAIYIMPPIAAGIYLTSISNMYNNILIYYKKTQYIMISSGAAALLNLVLNYICIPKWGYIAAAYTTLVAYILLAGMQGIISVKVCSKLRFGRDKAVYDDKMLFLISTIVISLCLVSLFLYHSHFIRYMSISIIFFLCLIYKGEILRIIKY